MTKKEKILEVAEELFGQKGFSGTSISDIASAAGVSKSLIFHYFESKNKIIENLLNSKLSKMEESISEIFEDKNLAPIEKILSFVDDYVKFLLSNSCLFQIILRESINEDKKIEEAIGLHTRYIFEKIRNETEEGQKSGALSKEINPHFFSFMVLSQIHSLVFLPILLKDVKLKSRIYRADYISDQLKKLILKGVLAE